jgi:hypothetical protein
VEVYSWHNSCRVLLSFLSFAVHVINLPQEKRGNGWGRFTNDRNGLTLLLGNWRARWRSIVSIVPTKSYLACGLLQYTYKLTPRTEG